MHISMLQLRDLLRERIAISMQNTANKLSSGRAPDYAQYRQMVGRIEGNRDALDEINKVFVEFLNEGENE